MKNKISIIVPIYNVEKYLRKSLQSIVEQTIFENLEVILVNDGSTDSSYHICKEFKEKYDNFILINKENEGVSSARNLGIKNAHSQYICFFDADDSISTNYYEQLLHLMENKKADIGIVNFFTVHEKNDIIPKKKVISREYDDKEEILKIFLSGHYIGNNVFDKIYSQEILKNIEFFKGKSVGEDMYFNYQALKSARKIYIDTSKSGYYYYKRNGSAMNSKFSDKYFDTIELSELIQEELKENKNLCKYAEAHKFHEICKVLEYMMLNHSDNNYNEKFKKYLKEIKKYPIRDAYKYLSLKQFCGIVLMKVSPKIYIKIFKILKIG